MRHEQTWISLFSVQHQTEEQSNPPPPTHTHTHFHLSTSFISPTPTDPVATDLTLVCLMPYLQLVQAYGENSSKLIYSQAFSLLFSTFKCYKHLFQRFGSNAALDLSCNGCHLSFSQERSWKGCSILLLKSNFPAYLSSNTSAWMRLVTPRRLISWCRCAGRWPLVIPFFNFHNLDGCSWGSPLLPLQYVSMWTLQQTANHLDLYYQNVDHSSFGQLLEHGLNINGLRVMYYISHPDGSVKRKITSINFITNYKLA